MNRYFISDKESDTLIALATKLYGLKIGELINIALKNEFLPVTEPFRTEAAFILQCNAKGTLDAWEIKQSMSRGIRALGTRPVYDSERLQGIFARYHLHEKRDNCSIANDEALWESAVEVYEALGKPVLSDCSKLDGARLVDDIFADWDTAHSNAAWQCRLRSTGQSSWTTADKIRTARTTAANAPRCCGHGHYRYRAG